MLVSSTLDHAEFRLCRLPSHLHRRRFHRDPPSVLSLQHPRRQECPEEHPLVLLVHCLLLAHSQEALPDPKTLERSRPRPRRPLCDHFAL